MGAAPATSMLSEGSVPTGDVEKISKYERIRRSLYKQHLCDYELRNSTLYVWGIARPLIEKYLLKFRDEVILRQNEYGKLRGTNGTEINEK